jgi:hypothetical protein
MTDDKALEALRLRWQRGNLGAFKERVELAAAQYLGPVHKLWEGGAKLYPYRTDLDVRAGLVSKAEVSGLLLQSKHGPELTHLVSPGPAPADAGASLEQRSPDSGLRG